MNLGGYIGQNEYLFSYIFDTQTHDTFLKNLTRNLHGKITTISTYFDQLRMTGVLPRRLITIFVFQKNLLQVKKYFKNIDLCGRNLDQKMLNLNGFAR